MNLKRKSQLLSILGMVVIGLIIGSIFAISQQNTLQAHKVEKEYRAIVPPTSVESEYIYLSLDEMASEADMVVVGEIVEIGSTQWNQDNGEYWEEVFEHGGFETIVAGHPYFNVTLRVDSILHSNLSDQGFTEVTFSVLELNPTDHQVSNDHIEFSIGDQVLAFGIMNEIGWYRGEISYDEERGTIVKDTQALLTPSASPEMSFLMQNESGLFEHHDTYLESTTLLSIEDVIHLLNLSDS